MLPTKQRFLSDVLLHAETVVEDNWEPWCHLSPDPAFWREQGSQWLDIYTTHWDRFAEIFEILADDASCQRLYALMLYRVLGYRHVKLPLNTPAYWAVRQATESAVVEAAVATSWNLTLDRLRWRDIEFIGHPGGHLCLFGLKQYQFDREVTIRPEPGETVLDLGGCWGDSGLAFADLVGETGRVYVFEFVPSNLDLMRRNFAANPRLAPRLHVVPHPVGGTAGEALHYVDQGPATRITPSPEGATGRCETVTIDSFVAQAGLDRVDFIKMDIEGIEEAALLGAADTIRRWKPKLAISAYHRPEDLVNLPARILHLHPDYRLYLDSYTLFDQEIVVYAR